MENGRTNIEEILSRYFEGTAGKSEVKMAEDYLLMHPEYMESFEEKWNLRLGQQEKEFFPEEILYKSYSDLDREQMMLLAAAAAEGDISSEETDSLFEAINNGASRKISVSDFKNLKLKPFDEGYRHKSRLIKINPVTRTIRRSVIYALAAAAVVTIFVISAPLSKKAADNINPATYVAATVTKRTGTVDLTAGRSAEAIKPAVKNNEKIFVQPESKAVVTETNSANIKTESETTIYLSENQPLMPTVSLSGDIRPIIAYTNVITGDNKPLSTTKENWMIKGITGAIASISNFRKAEDTFTIADQSIKEVNKLLGWNMQLEKVAADGSSRETISFRSDLVSFSKQLKKKQ